MSRYDYCKTCINGGECIAYSKINGCVWHNSPEKCKSRDDAQLKKESAATSHNIDYATALWHALCAEDVREAGCNSDGDWVPVNVERLNAALRKLGNV